MFDIEFKKIVVDKMNNKPRPLEPNSVFIGYCPSYNYEILRG